MGERRKSHVAADEMAAHHPCAECKPGDSEGMCLEMARLYAAYLTALAGELGIDAEYLPGVRAYMRRVGKTPKEMPR